MKKNKKSQKKEFVEISDVNFVQFIGKLKDYFHDLNNVPWCFVDIEGEIDYGPCYYEGDIPGISIKYSLRFEKK